MLHFVSERKLLLLYSPQHMRRDVGFTADKSLAMLCALSTIHGSMTNTIKIATCIAAAVFGLAGCFPKASGVIMSLPVESKEQILARYDEAQLQEGKAIFASRCTQCHALKDPASRDAAAWNKILKRMIPMAKLDDAQGQLVRAYLIANSEEK